MTAYERSESVRDNFGEFIHYFQSETKTLVRKLENVSLLFNPKKLNVTHTHTHTHTYIYIYIYIYF